MLVKEFYDTIGGNYNKAIETLMNDDFIKRMLMKFSHSEILNDLIKAYQNNDMKGIFAATHTLKGVAGNLSLTPLYEKASIVCEMTRNVKEGEIIRTDKEMEELIKLYQLIIYNVKTLLS